MNDLYSRYLDCGGRVTTDSRTIEGGEMFFALKGENFDGNRYALSALEKGAAYAVVDDASLPDTPGIVKVPDSFKALQELAIWHRTHVSGGRLRVIGLTGTNGKTTTKELIREVLATKYRVCATEGNLNNDIGVPLSLLRIRQDTELAVMEMGANHPDDIAKLVKVCRPDYGLITNVGKAHLLGFGSIEGVKAAKGELYKWLAGVEGGVIFLNEDDPALREMAAATACHTFGYGLESQGVQILPLSKEHPFLRLQMRDGSVLESNFVGSYNATNMLAALSVGEYFGVRRADGMKAIAAYSPANKRSQMIMTGRNTVIADTYNANPSSMKAALDNFSLFCSGRKAALLGDMRELGEDSVKEHVRILEILAAGHIPAYLVGEEFRKALECSGIRVEGWFADSDSLAEYLESNPISDSAVLVKGSRGIRMEKVLPKL